jgi:hypothetical protein
VKECSCINVEMSISIAQGKILHTLPAHKTIVLNFQTLLGKGRITPTSTVLMLAREVLLLLSTVPLTRGSKGEYSPLID